MRARVPSSGQNPFREGEGEEENHEDSDTNGTERFGITGAGRIGRRSFFLRRCFAPVAPPSEKSTDTDDGDLEERIADSQKEGGGCKSQGDAKPVEAQFESHAPHGVGHHRDGGQLETGDRTRTGNIAHGPQSKSKSDHQYGRGQGESDPRCEGTACSRPLFPECKSHLTAGRTGQELAKSDQVRVFFIGYPLALAHQFFAEVSQMSHGSAKGDAAEAQKCGEDLCDTSPLYG